MTADIVIVTHAGAPDGVADDHLLAEAIAGLGGTTRYAVWDDASVDWSSGRLTVVRSTWDYHLRPARWHLWLDLVASVTRVINAPDLIRWNSEKTYLLDLLSQAIPVVPTSVLDESANVVRICADRGWTDVVIKPTIGASAFGARRFRGNEIASGAEKHVRHLLINGTALLQPYQAAIEDMRERSLVFIDGVFSHAFTKPGFHGGLEATDLPIHSSTREELDVAGKVMAALPGEPVIARIDLIPSPEGPLVMEAELVEPQLALHHNPQAPQKLASAILRRC